MVGEQEAFYVLKQNRNSIMDGWGGQKFLSGVTNVSNSRNTYRNFSFNLDVVRGYWLFIVVVHHGRQVSL